MKKIPKLRFKKFVNEWQEKKLENICNIYDGTHQTPKYVEKGVKFVSVEDIKNINQTQKYISKEDFINNFKIKPQINDILMTRITAGIIGDTTIVKSNEPLGFYVSLALIRKKENIDVKFLNHYINSSIFKNELHKKIIHVAFPKKINLGDIGKCKISIPTLKEQEKIADFLSSVDVKINLTEKKLELLKEYKKGIIQKIFSQKLKFKDKNENNYPDWKEERLEKFLIEYNEKTTINNQYPTISSTATGIYLQEEYFNRQIASSDNTGYKILNKNQLVFSPQNLWLGNININLKYEKGIVSPSYKIFDINENFTLIDYFKHILKTNRMLEKYKNVSEQGASIVRRNLDMKQFLEIKILLPCLEEQQKIADFLSSIDTKIEKISDELKNLKEFKKGLLQQMFV